MTWPWSELGLKGPADLETVRRAYAQRLKAAHPEEDPEGFQRLHKAYQEARRAARLAAAPAAPAPKKSGVPRREKNFGWTKPDNQSLRAPKPSGRSFLPPLSFGTQPDWTVGRPKTERAGDPPASPAPCTGGASEQWDFASLLSEEKSRPAAPERPAQPVRPPEPRTSSGTKKRPGGLAASIGGCLAFLIFFLLLRDLFFP